MLASIKADSLQESVKEILGRLLCDGESVDVRGYKTLELHPCLIEITNPQKRTLLYPRRGNNPFATLAETMWVLSGRNDVKWLSMFLSRAKEFSDDYNSETGEGVWRAGYGPRIRNWQGFNGKGDIVTVDQLEFVINQLKKDSGTRQAVISIWDPAKECTVGSTKDFPCFVGSTIIHSPAGNISIKDIGIGYPVFCYDEKEKYIKVKKILNKINSGKKRIWKVYLDDDSIIETTEDHLFMTKYRERLGNEMKHGSSMIYKYIKCKDLQNGDSLVPIHYFVDNKGHELVHMYPNKNWANKYRQKKSRLCWEFYNDKILDDHIIHHKDKNVKNNNISNLECLHKIQHDSIETAFQRIGKNNPNAKTGTCYKDIHNQRSLVHSEEELINFGKDILKRRGRLTYRIWIEEVKNSNYRLTELDHTFGSFGNFKSIIYNNHKVLKVEQTDKFEDVYDIEVEDCHNFFVGSGVLVHNCSNWLHFMIRNNALDLTVVMRSNDCYFGWSAINLYEFTVIQEIVANVLGVKIGKYFHLSDSMHVYEKFSGLEGVEKSKQLLDTYVKLPELPVFEFCVPDNDLINADNIYENYMREIIDLCKCLENIKELDVFQYYDFEDLQSIYLLLNFYITCPDCKIKRDEFEQIWKKILSIIPFCDLAVACHYWIKKNKLGFKDTGEQLIAQCIQECKEIQEVV